MLRRIFTTPRSPEPLPAVLAGAGFFVFLAALTGLGPFQTLDQAFWRASQPGQRQVASQAAVRVLGQERPLSGSAKVDALIDDVTWLRHAGAGAIVLEAWMDEAPQAEARVFADQLAERFQFLAPGAKKAAMQALTETTALIDAAPRLAAALGAAQPLVLAWQAVPGGGRELPAALRHQGYEVTLRGQRQRLPEQQALHLPWDDALVAVARSGACPQRGEDGRLPAVVEIQGRWYNDLGLEAARLALGLPLEGLRYRWRKGELSSLELKGARYPLDGNGRILLAGQIPALPSVDMARLRADAQARTVLQGKVIFFRPWPRQMADANSFDDQGRLFSALVQRQVLTPPAGVPLRLVWILVWAMVVLGLAWLPYWAGALLWAAWPIFALQAFWQEPQGLSQPLSLALSALLLGLGWRLQRLRRFQALAQAELQGRVAPRHQSVWRRRLGSGGAGVLSAYAVLGPRKLLQGPVWERWMARWGAYLDADLSVDGSGVVFAGQEAERVALESLAELRQALPALSMSLAFGGLSFQGEQRLGAKQWGVQGPPKELALQLQALARSGQCLILENDYNSIRKMVRVQVTGQLLPTPLGEEGQKVLNLLVMTGKL